MNQSVKRQTVAEFIERFGAPVVEYRLPAEETLIAGDEFSVVLNMPVYFEDQFLFKQPAFRVHADITSGKARATHMTLSHRIDGGRLVRSARLCLTPVDGGKPVWVEAEVTSLSAEGDAIEVAAIKQHDAGILNDESAMATLAGWILGHRAYAEEGTLH